METDNQHLKRTLGFFPALATVVGSVIGSGVFFKAASIASATDSTGLFMFSWFLGGVITVCAALTGAEMAAAIPETGGMLRYIDRTFGERASFMLGWAQVVLYFPAEVAALSVVFGGQFVVLFGLPSGATVPVAIGAALLTALLNFLGSRVSGILQSVALVLKLIPISLIIIFGLFRPGIDFQLFPLTPGDHLSFLPALGAGLLASMYAYNGWIYVGNIAGELKDPSKNLPRAIGIGVTAVMVIYLLINAAYLHVMPLSQLAGNQNAASQIAGVLFGGLGGKLVTIGILVSVYGTINGYTLTGMRQPYALSTQRLLPFWRTFEKLKGKSKTPVNSGILELLLASVLMVISTLSKNAFDTLTNMLIFVIWIFYTLVFVGVFILRKKEPELPRPYKVPLYPVLPAIAILGGIFLIIMSLYNDPLTSVIGIVVTLLALPVYAYMKQKKKG